MTAPSWKPLPPPKSWTVCGNDRRAVWLAVDGLPTSMVPRSVRAAIRGFVGGCPERTTSVEVVRTLTGWSVFAKDDKGLRIAFVVLGKKGGVKGSDYGTDT